MSDSLTIFTRAALMLAEADTIQKAKELKDLALTAADWARRKDMGEEAILHCRSYALDAGRKMGELLQEAQLHVGRKPMAPQNNGTATVPFSLTSLGVSKNQSSRAQRLADLPAQMFEQGAPT